MASTTLDVIIKAKDEATAKLKSMSGAFSALGTAAKVAGGVAATGIAALGLVLKKSMEEGKESIAQQKQLEAVLKSTGGAAGVTADAIDEMNNKLSELNVIDDDVILAGENMLLTFTNIGKDTFPRATQAMLDMATKMNNGVTPSAEALKGTAIQLGKALNDPEKGLTALSRVGVAFTKDQEELIKGMVKMGNTAGAQAIILAELEKEFGGSAAAAGNVDPYQKLNLALNSVYEMIGKNVIPIMGEIITKIQPVLEKFLEWANVVLPIVMTAISEFVTNVITWVTNLGVDWGAVWKTIQDVVFAAVTFFMNEILPTIKNLFDIIVETIKIFKRMWDEDWGGIREIFKFAWDTMKIAFDTVWALIKNAIAFALAVLKGDWSAAWDAVKNTFSAVWEGIKGIAKTAVDAVINTVMAIPRAVQGALDAISKLGGSLTTSALGQAVSTTRQAIEAQQSGGLMKLASGGIVTRPTRALIGEGGEAEAVIPLSKLGGIMSGSGGSSLNVQIDFRGSTFLSERVAEQITDMVVDKLKRVTKLPSRSL